MIGQTIRPGILGKIRKKLETMEGQKPVKKETMKMIPEEEETEEEKSEVREWMEEDEDEMGNMVDLHYEL